VFAFKFWGVFEAFNVYSSHGFQSSGDNIRLNMARRRIDDQLRQTG
jgi:hypothetical protein